MRILHLLYESRGDYFGIGGVAVRAYEIYKYLRQRHDITLLCKKYPDAKDGEINGLRHIFVGTESRSLTKTLLSYASQAARFVKKYGNDYDIIIEDFSPAIPTFLHAFTERPIVLQVQGCTGKLYFRKYNPAYALILYTLELLRPRFYDNFIFINGQTIKKLLPKNLSSSSSPPSIEGGGLYVSPLPLQESTPESSLPLRVGVRGCIEVIPNGVSPDLLNTTPEDGDYILYLGRIDIYGKGLDTLIEAYREFFKSFPDIRLVIAGDGRDKKQFDAMLMKLPVDIRKNIELSGWISGDRKTEIIRKALFCVFPSRHEVQGITTIEAMACGKAIIVSDIPEFKHITTLRAGLSFETDDAQSLASSMKDLISSNERREMGQRGRELVKDYTWGNISIRYERFLDIVLNKS